MNDFVQYKCPCCGAALRFSPGAQKLSCASCGNEYDLETLRQYEQEEERGSGREEEQELNWEYQREAQGAKRTEDGKYICPSCGAEIEADENTVRTTWP